MKMCEGTTFAGKPCGAPAYKGERLCFVHGHRAEWEDICRAKHGNHAVGIAASRARTLAA